jgi:hypothetical protein
MRPRSRTVLSEFIFNGKKAGSISIRSVLSIALVGAIALSAFVGLSIAQSASNQASGVSPNVRTTTRTTTRTVTSFVCCQTETSTITSTTTPTTTPTSTTFTVTQPTVTETTTSTETQISTSTTTARTTATVTTAVVTAATGTYTQQSGTLTGQLIFELLGPSCILTISVTTNGVSGSGGDINLGWGVNGISFFDQITHGSDVNSFVITIPGGDVSFSPTTTLSSDVTVSYSLSAICQP